MNPIKVVWHICEQRFGSRSELLLSGVREVMGVKVLRFKECEKDLVHWKTTAELFAHRQYYVFQKLLKVQLRH